MIVMEQMKVFNKDKDVVSVVGLGYVGLTLSVVMAEKCIKVTGIDKNNEIFNCLSKGRSHFYEKGIQPRIADLVSEESNAFFKVKQKIDDKSDVWIITVGTPLGDNEQPTLSFLEEVSNGIATYLKKGDLVIARSTVPVGTIRSLVIPILEEGSSLKAGSDFHVVFAPERTIEGAALEEIQQLPQIVGGYNEASVQYAKSFFEHFVSECVVTESLEAAEMVKLIDNTYRDFIFSYANQMSMVASKMGINFNSLVEIANYNYSRNKVPMPSPGVGGACLSKDPYLLRAAAKNFNTNADFIVQGRKINESMPGHLIALIEEKAKSISINLADANIFIMGMAFKGMPPTSDLRSSVSLDFLYLLKEKGCGDISAYDEYVSVDEIQSLGIDYNEVEVGVEAADIIMILNNNPTYIEKPMYSYLTSKKGPVIFFDGWNQFNSNTFKNIEGLNYIGC
jgi:UDP-N-acetyl-D-mannosaminuronic acid dehydrogenase